MRHPAEFSILAETDRVVLIADQDRDHAPSVTNDAERVVPRVDQAVGGLGTRRLYYMDSAGDFDELVHNDKGHFVRFAPGPVRLDRLRQWVTLTGRPTESLPVGENPSQAMRDFVAAFEQVVRTPAATDAFMEIFDRVLQRQHPPAHDMLTP